MQLRSFRTMKLRDVINALNDIGRPGIVSSRQGIAPRPGDRNVRKREEERQMGSGFVQKKAKNPASRTHALKFLVSRYNDFQIPSVAV